MKIAIIEDNPSHLSLIQMILESYGFDNIVVAEDGLAGFQLILDEKPDLVLLDLDLPIVHGYQVASNIRFEPSVADTPIVAVTSSNPTTVRKTALEAGIDAVVNKHNLRKELPDIIKHFFDIELAESA